MIKLKHLSGACVLALVILTTQGLPAERRREPLSSVEIEQLRDTAQEPGQRIALYVKFIRTRADSLERLYSDPRFQANRAPQIHDLIEDIDRLVQEMDDNIDGYVTQRADLRKPLEAVVETEGELGRKLQAMQQNTDAQSPQTYGFVLNDVIDSVNSSLENARHLLQEQK